MDANTKAILEFQNRKVSAGIAYLLLFIAGPLGAHRFYTKSFGVGIALIMFTAIIAIMVKELPWWVYGPGSHIFSDQARMFWGSHQMRNLIIASGIMSVWLLIEAFLLPGAVRRRNEQILTEIA